MYNFGDNNYCNKKRWGTYYEQLKRAVNEENKSFLIIGPGDNIVPVVLKHLIPDAVVETYDIKNSPTYKGDLCDFSFVVGDKSWDCILCCQVLEHIDFSKFENIVDMISRHSNKQIIISVPHKLSNSMCEFHKWEMDSSITPVKIKKILSQYGDVMMDMITDRIYIYDIKKQFMNNGVSICIAAYDVCEFIKESLDSVVSQTWFKTHDNWEIIVGIDGCEKTLEYLKPIMHNYKNLKVLMMDSNKGTYVTTNTLMKNASYENIFRFDADDIMFPDLVETVMNKKEDASIVRYGYVNENSNGIHKGAIFIKKSIFLKYGGFRPWKCSGDVELCTRLKHVEKYKEIADILCYYRINENSLTRSGETVVGGELRKNYHLQIRNDIYTPDEAVIDCVTNTYKEIQPMQNGIDIDEYKDNEETIDKLKKHLGDCGISICLTLSDNWYKNIDKCIDSIIKQNWFVCYIMKYEILIGVDNDESVVKVLKDKYVGNNYNIKIFNMNSSCGKSTVLNTLISNSLYEHIVVFDTNYIMNNNLIESIMCAKEDAVLVRPRCNTYYVDFNGLKYGHLYIKKSMFLKYGGFNPDSDSPEDDLYNRLKPIENIVDISNVLMTKLQPDMNGININTTLSNSEIELTTNSYNLIELKMDNKKIL